MKKSFLILIAAIFLIAVVYVGVNGLQIQPPWDSRIYVDKIECKEYKIDESVIPMKYSESTKKYYLSIENQPDKEIIFQLLPKAYPENASILGTAEGGIVDSIISIGKNEYAYKYIYTGDILTVDEMGVVRLCQDEYGFPKTGVATVTIQSADGSGASTAVQIIVK